MATGLKQKGNYNTGMNLITQPRDINPMLQHQMIKYVNQLQHNKKILEGKQAKISLVALRNQWHNKQVKNNYQQENDRIRGILNASVLPGVTKEHIKEMIKTLENKFKVTDKFDTMF